MKKTFYKSKYLFLSLVLFSNLSADFLSSAADNLRDSVSIGNSGGISNVLSGGGLDTSNLSGILDQYGGQYLNQALDMGKDSILNNSALGEYLQSNSGWASGAMSMCYEYRPSSSNVNGDICSMFSNADVDVCESLPDHIGNYYKKSSSSMNFTIPLQDWCNNIAGETVNQPLKETVKQMGLSGKPKGETAGAIFNNDENDLKKEMQARVNNITSLFDGKETKENTRAQHTMKEVIKHQGGGAIALEKIKAIAKNTEEVSKEDTNFLNKPKVIFQNYEEYTADVETATIADYSKEKTLVDMSELVKLANEQFLSMNTENKTLSDKIDWISSTVEQRRKDLQVLANEKADNEIIYELPKKLGYYHAFFDKNLLLAQMKSSNLSKDAKMIVINHQIRLQEYEEKKIKVKWATWADNLANNLAITLKKAAIASEVFPEADVKASIDAMVPETQSSSSGGSSGGSNLLSGFSGTVSGSGSSLPSSGSSYDSAVSNVVTSVDNAPPTVHSNAGYVDAYGNIAPEGSTTTDTFGN